MLRFGREGDGGADYGDGDGDVGGPAEGDEVAFYRRRWRDRGLKWWWGKGPEIRVDGGGGGVLWVHGRRGRWQRGVVLRRGLLPVFVVVDVVHQRHELRGRFVEFDVFVLRLLHALDLPAERQHALHVLVVVRGVETRRGHVVLDEVPRLRHQLLHHAATRVQSRFPPRHRLPLLRIRHHVPGLVPRQRLHPEPPLVPRLHNPLRLPP